LLSAYETPEMRALFNNLKNFSGKLRIEKMWDPVGVPEGTYQVCNMIGTQSDLKMIVRSNLSSLIPAILKTKLINGSSI
jgi:hypothetical protein